VEQRFHRPPEDDARRCLNYQQGVYADGDDSKEIARVLAAYNTTRRPIRSLHAAPPSDKLRPLSFPRDQFRSEWINTTRKS
jgi:hypothetical protein